MPRPPRIALVAALAVALTPAATAGGSPAAIRDARLAAASAGVHGHGRRPVAVAPAPTSPPPLAGPAGDRFYVPPAALVPGPAGSLIWSRPATGLAALPAAARSRLLLYRSRNLAGRPIAVSGVLLVPHGTPPAGGWPVVSWQHVTTGSADSCAPSRVTPESPERERMTRGDAITSRLLAAGIAVVRSDGEGIGTPGPHPYLVGPSLARAQTEIVRAARQLEPRLARRWVAAGHSEGAVSSLFSASLARQLAPDLDLRGAAAAAPVTAMRETLDTLRHVPLSLPPLDAMTALGGLVVAGVADADPALGRLVREGALSPRATALLAHVEQRCLVELGHSDSWGGLAPAAIPGPRFAEAQPLLYRALDANDVRRIDLGRTPVRIDHGLLDLVAPFTNTEEIVRVQRERGADLEYVRHLTASHVDITGDGQAGPAMVAWIAARLAAR
ncbi:lipase family protein [Patulibacter defluvii]|uniref:lipase family protein n=1 Tax=Patulibacter defluvii TaxID=3095358 RepID=UPI002A74EA27|nr:lipase family protein [Patulibacter sp. DM4]